MPERYSQDRRNRVFDKTFLTRVKAVSGKHPDLYELIHCLIAALIESERQCRAQQQEIEALWRCLYEGTEQGQ